MADQSDSEVIRRVLESTRADVATAVRERQEENARRVTARKKPKAQVKEFLTFAIKFAKYMSEELANALSPHFSGIKSGENPSRALSGPKRLDVNFSTPEAGLGLAISLKSVHFGERDGGASDFTHNKKRNDEELRVEATAHHLRQPYAVMVAVVFLPFESCLDSDETSSFGEWVEYLWPLKGRSEPEDPPDRFELVFIALYQRTGTGMGFYEVGGDVPCPRTGRPRSLLSVAEFVSLLKRTYDMRNGKDFYFEGEQPI
jgi:hypothetical protein